MIICGVTEDGGEHYFHILLVPVYVNTAFLVDSLMKCVKSLKEFIT